MSKKISVDLTDENAGALYQNKEVHGLGYGPTINMLIRIFFRSPDIRDDLIEICKSKIQSGNLVYLDMLQFLTYDTQLTLDAVLDGVRLMKKINRRIFQPNQLTDIMFNGACDKNKANLSDFINDIIEEYYRPLNSQLKYETELLFMKLKVARQDDGLEELCAENGTQLQALKQETISPKELKSTLARCVEILKDYPIRDVTPLRQIFIHFTNGSGLTLRYDYINIVNSWQDEMLHHLNDVIKTVDPDYLLGTREFGERSKYIFAHWSELYQYSEIYIALATIIECEKVYYPLDAFTTISLIKQLDRAIMESSNIAPVKEPFAIDISNRDRYYGIRYEITMYYTHIGYSILSGDGHCENIPSGFQAFLLKVVNINTPPDPITEDNIDAIAKLETEGRRLLKQLATASN